MSESYAAIEKGATFKKGGSEGKYVWTESVNMAGRATQSCHSTQEYYYSLAWPAYEMGGYSSDGVYGAVVAEDIIITMRGTVDLTGAYPLILTYSDRAPPTVAGENAGKAVVNPATGAWAVGSILPQQYTWPANRASSGEVTMGLYVGKNALPGKYILPFMGVSVACSVSAAIASDGATVIQIIKPDFQCAVSAPSTIDFGQVPAKGDGWVPVASEDSTLQINCNSDTATRATGTISFTGSPLYYNHSEALEIMTLDGLTGVGIVHGRYGRGNQSICSPNDTGDADAVTFQGKVSKTLDLNLGTNEIPITWTLCRRGDAQRFGNVSAQATAIIDWD